MPTLNIDTSAMQQHAKGLSKYSKNGVPRVAQKTINAAAMDVKQTTMPATSGKAFKKRQQNFFKANSKVEFAKGLNMNTMKATVGFTEKGLKNNGKNWAVKDLEQQEQGGMINKKTFIPLNEARQGGNADKNVKSNLRLSAIRSNKKIINAHLTKVMIINPEAKKKGKAGHAHKDKIRKRGGGVKKQQFIRAAIMAKKLNPNNAFMLGNRFNGSQTLMKINKVTLNKNHTKIKITRTPIYTYRPKRKIRVPGTNFMKRASLESGAKMDKIFIAEATKQIKHYMKQ